MGDSNKHPGRSKGEDYKALQHPKSEHLGFLPAGIQAGTTIKTQDGKRYEYGPDGAVRRIE